MNEVSDQLALQHSLYTSSNPTRRYLHCARRDWVLNQIEVGGQCETAMEVGTGSGIYLAALANRADAAIAVDTSQEFLVCQRAEADASDHRIIAVQSALPYLPIASGSVDLLVCSEVIEHIPDTDTVVAELSRVLKPRGTLILTTPQPFSPLELLGKVAFMPVMIDLLRLIYREPVEPTGHINVPGRRRLRRAIERAGLRIESSAELGFYLPFIGEFCGNWGMQLLRRVGRILPRIGMSRVLWTQCYVLRQDLEDGT